jgi:hypothetical protein
LSALKLYVIPLATIASKMMTIMISMRVMPPRLARVRARERITAY